MEKQVKIRTADKHLIYGTLNGTAKERLIIFVHGLTGHQNEHMFYNAAKFFPKKGFSTFRFDLYSAEKNGRRFDETTISVHSADLDTVIRYFAKQFKKIYVVGHSLGGPTILLSKHRDIRGIVLWDPSEGLRDDIPTWCKYSKSLNAYLIKWNTDIVMSSAFYEEFIRLPSMVKIVQRLDVPCKIILAGKGILHSKWKQAPNCTIVKNATHCFDEKGVEELLFKHTLDFLQKNS